MQFKLSINYGLDYEIGVLIVKVIDSISFSYFMQVISNSLASLAILSRKNLHGLKKL